jgi:transposase InsO family protein
MLENSFSIIAMMRTNHYVNVRMQVFLQPRYNRTVRYDWLAHYLFDSIEEVQDYATQWLWTYNHERPNMALGGITPKQKLALAN